MTVGFLGAGHMGGAMLRGLAAADFRPALRVFGGVQADRI